MNFYLIANRSSNDLETIIFSGEGGDVVAVGRDLWLQNLKPRAVVDRVVELEPEITSLSFRP